jgi:hypothetical protein
VRAYDEDFLESMTIRSLHRILMADWDEWSPIETAGCDPIFFCRTGRWWQMSRRLLNLYGDEAPCRAKVLN